MSAVALALGIFSGCGSDAPKRPTTTPTTQTSAAPSAATSSDGATQTPAPEGKDLVPVDVQLDDGGFAKSTPHTFHVPSGFLVLVTAKNESNEKIRLSIVAPSIAQTFKIPGGKTQTITIASIDAGKSARLISGGQTYKITADADPGP